MTGGNTSSASVDVDAQTDPLSFMAGGGAMGALMRAHDWSAAALGAPAAWPQALKTLVELLLISKQPMFLAWGPEQTWLYNDAFIPVAGRKHPESLGRPSRRVWAEAWADLGPLYDRVFDGEPVRMTGFTLGLDRRGVVEDASFDFSHTPVRGEDGKVQGLFGVCTETTDRDFGERQKIAALERERDRLFEMTRDLFGVATFDGHLKFINPAWSRILDRSHEELTTRPFAEIIHPDDLPTTAAVVGKLRSGEPVHQFHVRLLKADGSAVSFAWSAVPEAPGEGTGTFYTVGRDITDDLRREEALRQSQKMEAVGQLTGGLAHDFNNLLAGISGSLELMGTRIAQGRSADVDRYLLAAQGAAKRAAALTHRLLAFSRRQTLEPKPTDVNRLVGGMEELIRRTVGPQIDVEAVAKAGLWSVLVDPNQLENALLNLAINARDAMPDGGRITIETANRWLDDRAARERDVPPGQYVSLCVSDNGAGMPADVIDRAFDPFFTTKPIGVGTGLGLSMIYGFARQSGGQVRIYSEVGQGAMICIYLPRHHAGEADADVQAAVPEAGQAKAGEAVLVIDDEPIVRMLIVDLLEDLGYTALEAGDGPSGLKIIGSNARIDLLITDVGLPNGMNGRQVADAAREARPGLKVLFVTGYAENAVLSHGHLDPGMQVVTKPFDMSVFASRIKGMIAGG